MKFEYAGKDNVFSVDLQSIISKNINDAATLKDISLKNGKVEMNYEVNYGNERPYNLEKIESMVAKLNSKVISPQDITDLINASAQDLSQIFNQVSITPSLMDKFKNEPNIFSVMKTLTDHQGVGNNGKHLKEFTANNTRVTDKVSSYFVQKLTDDQLKNMTQGSKVNLVTKLVKGGKKDMMVQVQRILANSNQNELMQSLDPKTLKHLKDKLKI